MTTWHNDTNRTGQNPNETILTPANVNPTQFGKLFSQTVDGDIYAQPLYLPGLTINGTKHNVVFVATENDTVYAFDADSNGGSASTPLWQASMLSTAHGAVTGEVVVPSIDLTTDIQPIVGITGTPVIDPTTNTLYVVSKALSPNASPSQAVQRLHALDVTTGAEKFGGPVVLSASVPGTGSGSSGGVLNFDSMWQNQRAGLLLLNGILYVSFGSHGDNGPWHGWVLAYNATTLRQTGAFCSSPNGVGSGIWMAGEGLSAEVVDPVNKPYGRMFVVTGNGDYTVAKPYSGNMDYGDSILNLDLTNGVPTVQDVFTPSNQASLDSGDVDLGSGGVLLLPTQTSGSYPNLMVQSGKSGTIYLVNRDNMGGYNTSSDQVVQSQLNGNGGSWTTPAYWNGNVYYWGRSDRLKAIPLVNGQLSFSAIAESSEAYGFPGASPSISANGNTNGIVWSINSSAYSTAGTSGPEILQAHDASNVATTLYSSDTNASRDNPGGAVKFTVPTVVNGKVYVGASGQLSIYGLLNSEPTAATPVFTPGSESFGSTVSVSITDSTPGATIYYTTDGSTPTTASAVYTGPITLNTTTTLTAMASAGSYLQSAVSSASFVSTNQTVVPALSPAPGAYTSVQTVTMTDATPNANIYYTTDGSTPTTGSPVYTGPLTLLASTTIKAIANAPGKPVSAVATSVYSIELSNAGIDFSQGFAASAGLMILNGSTDLDDSRLQLTNGTRWAAGSAWYFAPMNIQSFDTTFDMQLSNAVADGITFTIQNSNAGVNALGSYGGGLGYATIPQSAAIKFDLYNNEGEGSDSTGLYLNGASPMMPATNLTSTGINLHSGDTMTVHLKYDGTTLGMTITDIVTQATYFTSWAVNLPAAIGSNTAFVGFTGGTGGSSSSQKILTWTFTPGSASAEFTPTPLQIDAGGLASGSYLADEDFHGGIPASTTAAINTSQVANPAPQAVYQTERYGAFTYTIPNLTAGRNYTVNLHFAEIYWNAAGMRTFNVLINGTTVLSNFDIFAAAGGKNIAIVKSFPTTATSNGTITIQFTNGTADWPKISGIEIVQGTTMTPMALQIDAGGMASGSYLADEDFSGGAPASTAAAINTSQVVNPAPQAVYQTERYGAFTYTIPNLTAGASYTVNLHFAEIYWNAVGQRKFNVLINGTTVLSNFDIFAAAGGKNIAIVKSFSATAASNGTIAVQFTKGTADWPKISGIEILSQ